MWTGIRVVFAEILEYLFETEFIKTGSMQAIPGTGGHSSAPKKSALPVSEFNS
jgi:hypothetical protein